MKRKYHAIPVIIYALIEDYPHAEDVYDAIKTPLDMEAPDLAVFFAEDYQDGIVELDPVETEFTGMINIDCPKSLLYKN